MYLSHYFLIKLERQPFFRLSKRIGSEMESKTLPEVYVVIYVRSHCSVFVCVSGFFPVKVHIDS